MSFYSKPFVYITVFAVSVLVLAVAQADETKVTNTAATPAVAPTPSATPVTPSPVMPVMPATDAGASLSLMTALTPEAMQWMPAPDILPLGTKIALLEGDPAKEGPFTMRIKLPANYMIAPHTHPGIEHVTVISGTFNLGVGEKFDSTNGNVLPAGSFIVIQPGFAHYGWGTDETVLQLHGIGPWGLVFVNKN